MDQGDNTGQILLKGLIYLTGNSYISIHSQLLYWYKKIINKFCKKKKKRENLITILIAIIYIYLIYHYIKALQI